MSRATITVDLGYGDSGKGTTTEFLAHTSESAVVIRHCGGPQAEHNVVTPDGRHHTFSQFGSASFLPDVPTHLSVDMMVNPRNMMMEAVHLDLVGVGDIWQRVTVDAFARIITPYHQVGTRLREIVRGDDRHGSTGQGISELIMDGMSSPELELRAGDLAAAGLAAKLNAQRLHKLEQMAALGAPTDTAEWQMLCNESLPALYADEFCEWAELVRVVEPGYLAKLAERYEHLVFEAAQGVLLDEWRGFHPYTTWSNTTADNARRQLADIGFAGNVRTLGIVRSYTTRHGYGPMVTEDRLLDGPLREYFTGTGKWQGRFRIGHFDSLAHRYALAAVGAVDGLVVTGLDRTEQLGTWKCAKGYNVADAYDLDEYFMFDHGVACDMKLGSYGDLTHMSRLTQLLAEAKPYYGRPISSSHDHVAWEIERQLGLPVVITSHGPTVNDKIVR